MAIMTASSARHSLLRYAPVFALVLATIAVALLALGPIGWRAGWWRFRFAFLNLMPWAAYFGVAALVVSALTLLLGRARIELRGIAVAVLAFAVGGLIAYVPWHYDRIRQAVPPIHDITTDPENPPHLLQSCCCAKPRVPTGSPMRAPRSPSFSGEPIPTSLR